MKSPILLRLYRHDKLEGVKQFELRQIVLGRNKNEGQLELDDPAVSALHAVIEERDEGYYLADLGSEGGTYKNGQKILDEPLQSGDEIKIGPFRLQFFIGVPKPAAPPKVEKPVPSPTPPPVLVPTPTPTPTPTPVQVQAPLPTKEPVPAVSAPTSPPPPAAPAPAPASVVVLTPPKVATENVVEPSQLKFKKKKAKGGKTFAPASSFLDARDIIKPSKGTVVEVLVTWKERVIATRHFHHQGVVTIGANPNCDLMVPILGAGTQYSLVKIRSLAAICLTQDMVGEVIREGRSTSFADLFKQNKLRSVGPIYELDLPQGEMARVVFHGGLVTVLVRYVPDTPKPLVAPLLDLTVAEISGLIIALVVVSIFQLYMTIYSPTPLPNEDRIEESLRKAIVIFPPIRPRQVLPVEDKPTQEKVEKKIVQAVEKPKAQPALSEKKPGKEGKAAEVAPSPVKEHDKKPKLTSVKPGGAIKTAPKEGASAPSQKPDPTKTGLLSAFGSKGTQSKLNQTFSGSGELTGLADQATGFAGNADTRPGDDIGTKLRDTGAGGKGSATVGISGVTTKSGKGGGTYGYGTGGIGSKGSVNIDVGGQEADFAGVMDKEAIRRIIQQNKNSIRSCYERSLQRHPDLYGKLVIEWDIEERGKVGSISVKSNTLGDDEVARCIVGRIKSLQFPSPPPDTTGRVTFPFVFSSQ